MADIKYEIVEQIGVISESAKGWTKELNEKSNPPAMLGRME